MVELRRNDETATFEQQYTPVVRLSLNWSSFDTTAASQRGADVALQVSYLSYFSGCDLEKLRCVMLFK